MFPWEWVDGLWATKSEGVGILSVQLVFKISNLCDPHPPTLYRQTDRRTNDTQSQYRALHYSASRGKNKTRQLAIAKKTARCAQYMGALKSFESPHYAPGYFSRNL